MKEQRRAVIAALLSTGLTTFDATRPASATQVVGAEPAGVHDFDFFVGNWRVRHRRLRHRLAHSREWIEFEGTTVTQKLLGGRGNVDDNFLALPGDPYRAVSLRAFDAKTGEWSIWWLDGRSPQGSLDPPVRGRFKNGVGTFYADAEFESKPIRVRFIWSQITDTSCHWEQAFSPDGGESWEINWEMDFTRER